MGRGRPTRSVIRQNMVEILYFLGNAYGYEIYKVYRELFPRVTLRVMYYHLRKGGELGEFKQAKVVKEEGAYSWGTSVERTYYSLGKNAKPLGEERVRKFLESKKKEKPGRKNARVS
ncbi:MAG: hypothetical protein ABIJ21_05480 [Nanoarchaeota archaeon]